MNSELLAAITGYLLTLAGIPADDWPADVLAACDTVAPLPAA